MSSNWSRSTFFSDGTVKCSKCEGIFYKDDLKTSMFNSGKYIGYYRLSCPVDNNYICPEHYFNINVENSDGMDIQQRTNTNITSTFSPTEIYNKINELENNLKSITEQLNSMIAPMEQDKMSRPIGLINKDLY